MLTRAVPMTVVHIKGLKMRKTTETLSKPCASKLRSCAARRARTAQNALLAQSWKASCAAEEEPATAMAQEGGLGSVNARKVLVQRVDAASARAA